MKPTLPVASYEAAGFFYRVAQVEEENYKTFRRVEMTTLNSFKLDYTLRHK
jgi:hypothetical protein